MFIAAVFLCSRRRECRWGGSGASATEVSSRFFRWLTSVGKWCLDVSGHCETPNTDLGWESWCPLSFLPLSSRAVRASAFCYTRNAALHARPSPTLPWTNMAGELLKQMRNENAGFLLLTSASNSMQPMSRSPSLISIRGTPGGIQPAFACRSHARHYISPHALFCLGNLFPSFSQEAAAAGLDANRPLTEEEEAEEPVQLALVGRPNVGEGRDAGRRKMPNTGPGTISVPVPGDCTAPHCSFRRE